MPSSNGFFLKTFQQSFRFSCVFVFFLSLSGFSLPSNAFAIHAIIKGGEPVPRTYGPLTLGMSLETFLEVAEDKEEVPRVIGQFFDEHQYKLKPLPASPDILNVVCDFYQGKLFRIELNYHPLIAESTLVQERLDEWTVRFGEPRVNNFPEVLLVFWDDGATRMILQSDESNTSTVYSITFIDDGLFHLISRERVQRETAGRSNYGKK